MTSKEADLFIKLMNMTQSENDHEALIAIRKANSILKSNNLSWKDFYQPVPTKTGLTHGWSNSNRDDDIADIFRARQNQQTYSQAAREAFEQMFRGK